MKAGTCDNHHGDDAGVIPKKGVDPDELKVIVTDAFEVIGARVPFSPPSPARPVPSVTTF